MILLVELTGYTDAGTSAVYRYSTAEFNTSPGDSPSNTHYEPRVVDPGSISRKMTDLARNSPRGEVGYGEIVLANGDGELDDLFGDGLVSFRERGVRVLMVEAGAAYSTAEVMLSAVIAQAELSRDAVSVSIKDASYTLASAHQTTTFAGTNSLPAGVEGVADLLGKVKPLLYGKGLKIEPPCVNTSKLIYQISARALQSVDGVYDGGAALTAGATYADQAAMEATAPSAGQYRAWLAGGMIRLGSSLVYGLTVDATADTSGNSTAAQLIKTLALARGWSSGDISSSDVTALDALNASVCGLWIDDSRSTLDAMDLIAQSVGACYWVDRLGVLRMARLDLPSGTSVETIAPWKFATVAQVTSGQDVPSGTARIKYAHYGRAQSRAELAGSVSDADAADLAQEWRVSTYSATPSPNPHKRLQTIERETALTSKSAADTESQRLQELWAAPRRVHECSGVRLIEDTALTIDLNAVVGFRWDRYGYALDSDTLRRVVGVTFYLRNLRCDLTLWGS